MCSIVTRLLLTVFILFATVDFTSAGSIPWQETRYSHVSDKENLADLLRDFCASQNINAVLSDKITGTVSGHFKEYLPEKFFDYLVRAYGLTWYYDGGILYLYRSDEMASTIISLRYLSTEELKATLTELDILDGRFAWKASGGGGVIYVTGPQRYAELVAQMADLLDQKACAAQGNEAIEVFTLKHAWADDLTFTYRDKEVIVPGVATILRNLLSGGNTPGVLEGRQEKQLTHTVAKLKGKGLAALGEAGKSGKEPPEMKKEGGGEKGEEKGQSVEGEPSSLPEAYIQPDTRMNAVIVRDEKERMPYYRELIANLDVPVGLVEIQATILDVNTDYLSELGIDWNVKAGGHNKYQIGFNADAQFVPGSPTLITGNGFNLATTITWGDGEYLLGRIHAMEDQGNARILSRPSVLTVNNTEALLEQNETFYVKVPGAYEVDLFNVTTGIMLKVTPHIIEEEGQNKIKLIVNIEDGTISDQSVDQIPIVNQSSINTQAVIRENESLLIGGTYHEIEQKNKRAVRVLGRVPLLGLLFQKKDTTLQKMERMFMITPRIVGSDSTIIGTSPPETR